MRLVLIGLSRIYPPNVIYLLFCNRKYRKDVYFNYSLQLGHKNSIQLNYFQPKYRNFTADVKIFFFFNLMFS